MSRLAFLIIALVVLLVAAVAAWCFFGPKEIASDELVPADTAVFVSIPNASRIINGYQRSHIKLVLENPNMQPLRDALVDLLGQKNVDLLRDFAPNLSGQSFIAITHFDIDHLDKIGLIAAMKPKTGLGSFDTFVANLKTIYSREIAQGKAGTGTVEGAPYEWIQGPGAADKICVAKIHGWIVTSWGEAPLADWIQRFEKKSTTPNLASDVDYRKALEGAGKDPMAEVYVSYHFLVNVFDKQLTGMQPTFAGDFVRKFETYGGAVLGTSFENGEIVDQLSCLVPKSQQVTFGFGSQPCPFETLRFTGPDTRFYGATSVNWKQYFHDIEEELAKPENAGTAPRQWLDGLHDWAHSTGLDLQHDVVDALGPECSLQVEWPENAAYPSAGFLVKLDHPIKPALAAMIDAARKSYAGAAEVKESSLHGQSFSTLKFTSPSLFTPTVTENGAYLGVFLNDTQAVRSFSPLPSITLDHDANFTRQIGDKLTGAAQILFLDSPYLLDRTYRTALPYLPFAEMFNKDVARLTSGHQLPDNLSWLAPVGTWSCVSTPSANGVQIYSTSGIGNQGIFLTAALGSGFSFLQSMGFLSQPKSAPTPPVPNTNATSPPALPH